MPRVIPRAYRLGGALSALALLGACATTSHYSNLPETVLYHRAYSNLIAANYTTAVAQLESLKATYPYGYYARQASLDVIFARLMSGDPRRAAHAASRFIHSNPRSRYIPYALYMEGIGYARTDSGPVARFLNLHPHDRSAHGLRRGFQALRTLLVRFPTSHYAPDARQRMIAIRNALARHQYLAARFYFQKGAWIAAANRLVHLLNRYPSTPSTPRTLTLLRRCYLALGETALASRVSRVLHDLDHVPGSLPHGLPRRAPPPSPPRP